MNKKIYLVGNSHIDPVWLWDYREGIDEVISTFKSACDRLDEYPEIYFSAGSAQFYQWVEEFAPEVFARIKKHVKAGRWEIVGDWWLEPDVNLPLEESLLKQIQLGKSYLKEKFREDVDIGYNPDSFGHSAALPKILVENGYRYYLFCRPGITENQIIPQDGLFYWEYEGCRILCYRLPYHYTNGADIGEFQKKLEVALSDKNFLERDVACYFYGVGNHGGGPTIAEIEYLRKKRLDVKNLDVKFSPLRDFFREAEKQKDIPVITGDLHCHAVGCYSVNRNIKEAVRNAEYSALTAERTQQMVPGGSPEPEKIIRESWKTILFNQFHDIMPGSCTRSAAEEAVRQLHGARVATDAFAHRILKKLSRKIEIENRQGGYVIWNTLPRPVKGAFEIEAMLPEAPLFQERNNTFIDQDGRVVPYQVVPGANSVSGPSTKVIIDEIPAKGYRLYYYVKKREGINYPLNLQKIRKIETKKYQIRAGANGLPASIYSKLMDREILSGPVKLLVLNDRSDTWGHGVKSYDEVAGQFEPEGEIFGAKGGLFSAVYANLKYAGGGKAKVGRKEIFQEPPSLSRVLLETRVYEELPWIEMRIFVNWNKPRSILKLEIPFKVGSLGSIIAQVPGGKSARPLDGAENPLQTWVRLKGLFSVALCQRGAYAYDCHKNRLRITLVRSSYYGYDQGTPLNFQLPQRDTDLGMHEFEFRIYVGKDADGKIVDRAGFEMHEPFWVMQEAEK